MAAPEPFAARAPSSVRGSSIQYGGNVGGPAESGRTRTREVARICLREAPPAVSLPSGAARFGRSLFGEAAGRPFPCTRALAIGQTGMREMDEQGGNRDVRAGRPRGPSKPAEPEHGRHEARRCRHGLLRLAGTTPRSTSSTGSARRAYARFWRGSAPISTLADDLTQDAFLRIHSARGQFAAGAPAMPWMFAIARNSYRDHLRREQVRREHRSTTAQLAASRRLERPEGSGDRALIAQQMLDIVQRTLMGVPVRQREAFVLMRFEGLDLAEAARVLGATEAAVRSWSTGPTWPSERRSRSSAWPTGTAAKRAPDEGRLRSPLHRLRARPAGRTRAISRFRLRRGLGVPVAHASPCRHHAHDRARRCVALRGSLARPHAQAR